MAVALPLVHCLVAMYRNGQRCTPAKLSPKWREVLGSCLSSEEEFLQIRPHHPLHPSPLLDGKECHSFHPVLGHDLRSFLKGGI